MTDLTEKKLKCSDEIITEIRPVIDNNKKVNNRNLTRVTQRIPNESRWQNNGHKGTVIWLTGLSGAGKTTLALGLDQMLFEAGYKSYLMDGDNIRHGLCSDLGFSEKDRQENIRRIGEVASLFANAGIIAIAAFISPYSSDRIIARQAASGNFHEIFLSATVETCENRDPKRLYKKARQGMIKDFTGISAPYEAPKNPDLIVDTSILNEEESVEKLFNYTMKAVEL